ncbi:hypothetical protein IPG36_06410 [bacterium]|nr:MAG: hypothetical protein IPG36_06410 [bacterium]
MPDAKPTKQQLDELATQIRNDQDTANPAEKRVKVDLNFKDAVKKMGQTPPPEKADK